MKKEIGRACLVALVRALMFVIAALAAVPHRVAASDNVWEELVVESEQSGFVRGIEFDLSFHTRYIDPDVGVVIYDREVVQTNLWFLLPAGAYVGVFASSGLDLQTEEDDFSDEIDWTLGKEWGLPGEFVLDTAVAWCDSQALFDGHSGTNDVLWARARVDAPELEFGRALLTPYGYVTGLWTFGDSMFEGGVVAGLGAEGSYELTERLRCVYDLMVGWDGGCYGNDPGVILKLFGGLEYDLSERWKIMAGGTAWCPLGSDNRVSERFATVTLSFAF